jgi:signal peptidase I
MGLAGNTLPPAMLHELPTSSPEMLSTETARLPRGARFPRRPSFAQQLSQILLIGVLAAASYLIISHFLVESVRVVGESMNPTLHHAQRYLLNRWVFHLRPPHPGEIVVIRDPLDNGLSVKRIVGVAGDKILIKDGHVYLNDHLLKEPYLPTGTPTFSGTYVPTQEFMCEKDQYLVLGDNRNNSLDSRAYGPIARQAILGLIVQ